MDSLDQFAPPVDIQAEMDSAPDVRIDNVPETPETPETPENRVEEPEQKEEKSVPIAALAEARRHAKDMRQRMEESDKQNAERIAELTKKLELLANPPAPEPSFDENPAENLRQRAERLEREQAEWRTAQENISKQTKAQQEQENVLRYVHTEMEKAEAEFSTKNPDYQDATKYLMEVSAKNLRASGITDAKQIQQISYQQALGMAANAIQQGLNPAEVAYQFARNYGYSPKVDASRQIKAMSDAQSITQNMGNGKPETSFSIAALAQMDDDELSEAIADNKIWSKIKAQG